MKTIKSIAVVILAVLVTSCAVIRPGQVGVKQTLGKLSDKIHTKGAVVYNPFVTKVIRVSVQTNNLELNLNIPTKEGLSVNSQISILYKLHKDSVTRLIPNIGLEYEMIIANVFRSASADVCSQYLAKDLHSGMRAEIEKVIKEKMISIVGLHGISIDAVLMKSIQLPAGLASSIEQKLQAEQEVMRMEFVLKQAKLEADRKIIDAKGERDAQMIIAEGLTDDIIKLRSIEAFNELAKSPNSKVIITDGQTPFFINSSESKEQGMKGQITKN